MADRERLGAHSLYDERAVAFTF